MIDRVGQQLGNYQLIRLLGTGGFADVYLGEHVYLKTQAAIKVMLTQLTDNQLEDFLNEARTVARLEHPNIVRVLEFGVQEGKLPFLVMTYAPNGTLRQRYPKGSQVPLPTIVSYVKQVASALQYAHNNKLVHRDIKPENMLIGRQNDILLSDFGLAMTARSSSRESTKEVAGTAAYMAPEQIHGHPRTSSDQYALGIIVYEWLSGEQPFHGSFLETCSQHLFAQPPSLRAKIPGVSPAVEQVVLKALQKDPYQRFPNVQAFADALEQVSPSQPAPPVPLGPLGSFENIAGAAQSSAIPRTSLCIRCGTSLSPNSVFCGTCGYDNAATATLNESQRTVTTSSSERLPSALPPASQYGQYGAQQEVAPAWSLPGSVAAPAFPSKSSQPKTTRKRTGLIISLVLLVLLLIAGVASYPLINSLLHPSSGSSGQNNLPCITPPSSVTPLFGDCFTDNSKGWNTTSGAGFSVHVSNSSLVLEDDNNSEVLPEVFPGNQTLSNFRLEVDAVLSQGSSASGYGVYIRGKAAQNGTLSTYYRFELFGDGSYAITSDGGTLVSPMPNSAIHPQGTPNHITIVAQGATLAFSVNGTLLKMLTDSRYASGLAALFVVNHASSPTGAQATFSRLVVYPSP